VTAELFGWVEAGPPRHLIIAATAKAASRMVVSAYDTAFADLPGVKYRRIADTRP